jgi:hypothetical protein
VCLDWETFDPGDPFPPELTCGLPELCPGDAPLLFMVAGPPADPTTVEVADLDRARCMAAAMRDRQKGQVFFSVDEGGWDNLYELEILGPQAILRHHLHIDFNVEKWARVRELLPSEQYDTCSAGDAREVWLCLTQFYMEECVTGQLACPPP